MSQAEHTALVEHYARLLYAYESARDVFAEGAKRADHWVHTRIRRSDTNVCGRETAEEMTTVTIPAILAEASEHGVPEHELRRWIFVLRFEAGEIKVPPTITDIVLKREPGT